MWNNRYDSFTEDMIEGNDKLRLDSAEIVGAIMRDGYISTQPNYNERQKTSNKKSGPTVFRFGNGLKAVTAYEGAGKHIIYKNDQKIAETSIPPFSSFEDSGLFLCEVEDGKCRFMNADGEFCFGTYGKRTGSFHHGYARIQKDDGTLDFIDNMGKELGWKMKKATDFIFGNDKVAFAEVRFEGAKNSCFITPQGEYINSKRYSSQAYLEEIGEIEREQ